MTGSKFNFKKWFSMKNDTVEEAQQRFKRSLICIPISLVASIIFFVFKDMEISRFVEAILFVIWSASIASSFVAISSPLGPIKAIYVFFKRIIKKPTSMALIILFPVVIVLGILLAAYMLFSILVTPVIFTFYGVYISKKNLDAVKEREMFSYPAPEAE